MSFLHQLQQEADALRNQQAMQRADVAGNVALTESACLRAWTYFDELRSQLNVIEPAAPALSLDGRTPWPAMRLTDFRFDARKKRWRDQEIHDYIALGWRILPRAGSAAAGEARANFPPDLARIEQRLQTGQVPHERREQRHPDTNRLQEVVFLHEHAARASVMIRPDHERAHIDIRLGCVTGFDIGQAQYSAAQFDGAVLDELARLIVGQPSRFNWR